MAAHETDAAVQVLVREISNLEKYAHAWGKYAETLERRLEPQPMTIEAGGSSATNGCTINSSSIINGAASSSLVTRAASWLLAAADGTQEEPDAERMCTHMADTIAGALGGSVSAWKWDATSPSVRVPRASLEALARSVTHLAQISGSPSTLAQKQRARAEAAEGELARRSAQLRSAEEELSFAEARNAALQARLDELAPERCTEEEDGGMGGEDGEEEDDEHAVRMASANSSNEHLHTLGDGVNGPDGDFEGSSDEADHLPSPGMDGAYEPYEPFAPPPPLIVASAPPTNASGGAVTGTRDSPREEFEAVEEGVSPVGSTTACRAQDAAAALDAGKRAIMGGAGGRWVESAMQRWATK